MLARSQLHTVGLQMFDQYTDPGVQAQVSAIRILVGDQNNPTFTSASQQKYIDAAIQKLKDAGLVMGVPGTPFDLEAYYRGLIKFVTDPWVGKSYDASGPNPFTTGDFDAFNNALSGDRWLTLALGAANAPSGAFGGDPFGQAQASVNFLGSLQHIIQFLLDPMNWIRIGALLLGGILIWKGASSVTGEL